jgi:feruloyl esterase
MTGVALVALLAGDGAGRAKAATPGEDVSPACNQADIQAMAPADTTIVSAESLKAPVPHCKVEGYVTATNPGPNRDNFRLQLPAKSLWKGRYYFIGLGGSAGYVPTESQIPSGNPMRIGFAVAGTDTGRQGSAGDYSFLSDPVKALDHTHRAAHLTTQAAQQITKKYYGAQKIWRYHSGCSGGGRMGGEAISHHPEDYDGVLLGQSRVGPKGTFGYSKFIQSIQEMNREPGAWLSPAKLKMVEGVVTKACDLTDGAEDGVIWDHTLCHYDVAQLQCKGADGPECLTGPEIRSIKAILRGPHSPSGKLLVQPMPISNISQWSMFLGASPPPWTSDPAGNFVTKTAAGYVLANTTAQGLFGPQYDILRDFHFTQADIDAWMAAQAKIGFHGEPDITQAAKTGAKELMWVGVSDPCCSDVQMENYVRGLYDTMGKAKVDAFIQLYAIPGMGHCGGGTGPWDAPDRLRFALMDWVENGKTPAGVVMHRGADRAKFAFGDVNLPKESGVAIPPPAGPSRDFLVCPFPMVSVFDKAKARTSNAVYEAANWSCKTSRS